jgi:MFS family permease
MPQRRGQTVGLNHVAHMRTRRTPDTGQQSQERPSPTAPTPAVRGSMGPLRVFGNRQYARLWAANFLSYTARWMQMPLLSWMILELTDSPWLVSLVGFFTMAPTLFLGLVGGVLVDAADRRRLLVLTQGISAVASVILAFFLLTGAVQVWQAYLTTLVTGAAWALSFPARRATIFDLVGSAGVTNAVAIDTVGMNLSRMIGPGLAGVLISLVGVAGGYTVVTLAYALGYVLLLSLRVEQSQRALAPRQPVLRNLLAGLGYVRRHPTILATVTITVVMNLLLFPYTPMVPVVARDVLHVGPTLMGALQAVEGFGALLGAICIASAVNINYHGRVFAGGSLLALTAMCVFSLSRTYLFACPTLFFLGLGTAGFATMQSALIMLLANADMRGRALGVVSLAIGAGPIGSLWIGAVADSVSPVFAIRINALLGIVALACLTLVLPSIMDRTQPATVATTP